jgi:aspartate aminotransferase
MLDEFELNGETLSFAPGGGFYTDGNLEKNKARFSFCASEPTELERCAEILKKGIEAYLK